LVNLAIHGQHGTQTQLQVFKQANVQSTQNQLVC